MPLPKFDCEIPCSTQCHSMYDAAHAITKIAFDAVVCQMDPVECEQMTGYVTIGEPNNPLGNYVAGWIDSLEPRERANTQSLMMPIPVATVNVRILESGYPMINEDGPASVPDFGELNAAAQHSYSHAEGAMRAVYNAIRTMAISGCGFRSMGALRPVRPSGGMVGWQFSVTLDLEW